MQDSGNRRWHPLLGKLVLGRTEDGALAGEIAEIVHSRGREGDLVLIQFFDLETEKSTYQRLIGLHDRAAWQNLVMFDTLDELRALCADLTAASAA